MEVFENIAPVSPEKTLEAIEHAASGNNGKLFTSRENIHFYKFAQILRQLAYDPKLFDRSVELLCRYVYTEKPNENYQSVRENLKSLFYIVGSGTHASIEVRAKVIKDLLNSREKNAQTLGLSLLDATLATSHFGSFHDFSFGARPRDYGYHPKSPREVSQWYETFIGICTNLATSGRSIAQASKRLLCNKLRGLWSEGNMFDALEKSIKIIHEQQAWNEGWLAVRGIIRYDSKGFDNEVKNRIINIEKILKPKNLLELARTYALSDEINTFELEDDFDDGEDASLSFQRVEETTREIGAKVVQDINSFNILLSDIVSTYSRRLHSFGMGLADGSNNKQDIWENLKKQVCKTPPEKRQISVLLGFLSSCAENDPLFYNLTLDSLIKDDLFGEWFPFFQTTSNIDKQGIKRLHEALDYGKAKIDKFEDLAYRNAHKPISDDDLAGLLKKMLKKESGLEVVIKIMAMRFHGNKKKWHDYSKELIIVGRDVLSTYTFPKEQGRNNNLDYALTQIAHICLNGEDSVSATTSLCRNLVISITINHSYFIHYPQLLNIIAKKQPSVFLNELLASDCIHEYQYINVFNNDYKRGNNPLNHISDKDILDWCDRDPGIRYPQISSVLQSFTESCEDNKLTWEPIIYSILSKAPNLDLVIKNLANSIRPTSVSGSLSSALEKRSMLLKDLYHHDNPLVRELAEAQYLALEKRIKSEKEIENQIFHDRNESFE